MAGVDVGTAYLTIVPSARGFAGKLQAEVGGGMESAGRSAGDSAAKGFGERFKSGISTVAKAGALALGAALAGGVAFTRDAIGEAREAQKVGALTEQVIKSTGGAAKISAEQVGDLATAISNKTGVDDEAIQSGANLLLTFKNVKNEVGDGANIFDRATAAAADLSAAGFGDMSATSKQLGKALNDPLKGITALSRSGVTFTKQQKEQIETLVASGKTLDAQKIILGEVESQVGGAAAASATAGEKMAVAWGNFKEGIGTSLLPFLDKAQGFITSKFLPGLQGVIDILFKGDFTKAFGEAFNISDDSGAVTFLFKIRDGFGAIKAAVSDFIAGFTLKEDVGAPLEGFVGVGQRARTMALALFGYLKEVLPPIWESAKKLWPSIKEIGKQLLTASKSAGVSTWGIFKAIIEALPGILNSIAPVLESIAKWMGENKDIVAALVVALSAGMVAFKAITTAVKIYTAVQAALNIVMTANPIGIIIVAIAALAAGLIYAYKNSETFRNVVDTVFKAIGAIARWLWNTIFAPFFRFLVNGFATLMEWIGGLLDALGNIPGFGWAKDAAKKMKGAADKAREMAEGIKDIPEQKTVTISVQAKATDTAVRALKLASSGSSAKARALIGMEARATGGPVYPGGIYAVGDNPDGSWNRTTEVFVPKTAGTIFTQEQLAGMGGGRDLSQNTIDRLAFAMSQVQVKGVISSQSINEGLAVGM